MKGLLLGTAAGWGAEFCAQTVLVARTSTTDSSPSTMTADTAINGSEMHTPGRGKPQGEISVPTDLKRGR